MGVLIDKNMTWKYHIDYIASKISRVIVIIRLRPIKYFNPNLPFSDFCIHLLYLLSVNVCTYYLLMYMYAYLFYFYF